MLKYMWIVLLGSLLITLPQGSALAKELTLKWGLGTRSCAKFAADFKADPETWETLYYVWAEGYLTGFNLAQAAHGQASDLNPFGRNEKWRRESIREYCDQHPLAPYSQAVANLLLELLQPTTP
jgi:hypothetical protein